MAVDGERVRPRVFHLERARAGAPERGGLVLPDPELAAWLNEVHRVVPADLQHRCNPAVGAVHHAVAAGNGKPGGVIDSSVMGLELAALAIGRAIEAAGDQAPAQAAELARQIQALAG